MPTDGRFQYTFENLAQTMGRFTEALNLERFAIYVFDYGAPVGLRMALRHPERITAIISQNGNAYDEGLSAGWDSMNDYWARPTEEYRESLRAAFTPEATHHQYIQGVVDTASVSPDGSTLDDFYLARMTCSSTFSQTTVPMSRFIRNSRNISAATDRQFSPSGGRTTPTSSPSGPRPSDAIYPMPACACSTPGTSLWKPIVRRLRRSLASSWKRTLRGST
jgi:pimeloyl-ACP methyl ester carboxylesterase